MKATAVVEEVGYEVVQFIGFISLSSENISYSQ